MFTRVNTFGGRGRVREEWKPFKKTKPPCRLATHTKIMTDSPLGCRRRSLPRYLLSNQASPPPSPSGSTSSRSSCSSTSPRCSPTSSSSSRIGNNNHHHRNRNRRLPPIPSSVSLRHRLYSIYSKRTIRRLTFIVYNYMYGMASSQRLEGISRLCAVYSFTGILFTVR
jgi:hypothetical protein